MIKFADDFEIYYIMTSKITLSGIVLAIICLCASCLSDDSEIITYDDTAVAMFRLGNVKCYRTVKTAAGNDSTYSYTYSAATTPICIDQVNRRIFNEDSLTVGTDLAHILTTITAKSNGTALFKNLTDENWTLYSSTDSIDYSQQRILRIVSNDGQHATDYTVDIVCHREYADSFVWSRMPGNAIIASMRNLKATQTGNRIYVAGNDSEQKTILLRSDDGSEWTQCVMPSEADMKVATMAGINGTLCIYNDGTIYSTTDGETWTSTTPDIPLKALLGGYDSEMYALSDEGHIMVSKDNGATWAADAMESTEFVDNTDKLPATDITLLASITKTNSNVARITLVGNKEFTGANDNYAKAVVWNKVVDKDAPQPWTFTNVTWNNYNYILPRMQGLTAIGYADGILATGGTAINGTGTAYSRLYFSPDNGVTWHTQAGMDMPENVKGAQAAVLVNDGKGAFMIIAVNPEAVNESDRCIIWKGKQNKVLWKEPQKFFE